MTHKRWETLPTPPSNAVMAEAQERARNLLKQAEPLVHEAEVLADKFGFNLSFELLGTAFSDVQYIPEYTEESMWMPSNEEVEGSGYLDFTWTSSTEGTWRSDSDVW